jgi:pimeloyl-ACP methyl ester carboxylesterase
MSFQTIPGTTTQYDLIAFDERGVESKKDRDAKPGLFSQKVLNDVRQDPPSHVFLFSHGWKGDIPAAVDQYDRWIGAMLKLSADRTAAGSAFKPLWVGLHWPSLPFGDEEFGGGDSFEAGEGGVDPAALVSTYLNRLGLDEDARPLLDTIVAAHRKNAAATSLPPAVAAAYRELAEKTGRAAVQPGSSPEGDAEPFQPDAAFEAGNDTSTAANFGGGGAFLGGILGPLRQLSYWTMKKRARTIGESGMHDFVAALMTAAPAARVHLMGHSFGTIVMSSVVGGRGARMALPRKVDSLSLVQGAVSLWAFAQKNPFDSDPGYFNPLLVRQAVRGPIVVTRSRFDKAVGTLYPLASQISFAAPAFAGGIEPEEEDLPKYGAIGAFGIRGREGLVHRQMLNQTGMYRFAPGTIYNLESSQFICKGDGVSGAHSDIDGPEVAHALWQAASV